MLKRGLILVGLLLMPAIALADGPAYLEWLREQQAQGNPPGGGTGHPSGGAGEQLFDPTGGAFQLDYRLQIDKSGLMARLRALMSDPAWFGQYPEVQKYLRLYESVGAFNLAQYREAMTIDKDLLRYTVAMDYAGLAPDSYTGRMLALPNRSFASANYVNADVLFYCGMQNLPQTALIVLRELAQDPELMESSGLAELLGQATGGGMTADSLAGMVQMADAVGIEGMIESVLSGEIAVALYGVENLGGLLDGADFNPADIHAALFLGISDSAAAAELLTAYGADVGIISQGEQFGWRLYGFAGDESITFALGPDVLLATTNWQALNARMMLRMARLEVPDGQCFMSLNLDGLCQQLYPLAEIFEGELADIDSINAVLAEEGLPALQTLDGALHYLLGLDELGGAGAIRISSYYEPHGSRSEFTMKPAAFMYGLYLLGRWGGLAALGSELGSYDSSALPGDSDGSYYYDYEYEAPGAGAEPEAAIIPSGDDDLN